MRQNIMDLAFYQRSIAELDFIEERGHNWLKDGKIPVARIPIALDLFRAKSLIRTILKYTFGAPIDEVKEEFMNTVKYTSEHWVGLWTLKISSNNIFNQYILSAYDEMLWMLSLGYLLEIPDTDFKKFVDLIDKDRVKDFLFEFIIRAKIKGRESTKEESYREYFGVPKVFKKLRQAITETDKIAAEKLTRDFIIQDWLRNHKGAGWYNSHKSKHDTYFGYWSFETAAIVKIMGLDDSSFKDCQYYPKDLSDN